MNMNSKIKPWYIKKFPNSPIAEHINPTVTFSNILFCLIHGEDVYPPLGVNNMYVRDSVLNEIARRLGVTYSNVYKLLIK